MTNVLFRVAVQGRSMAPALEPGDRLLLLPCRRPRVGDIVAVRDPRLPSRTTVKRVAEVRPGPAYVVLGDNAGASTDSRHFGPVPPSALRGRAVYRYFPPGRAGRVRM